MRQDDLEYYRAELARALPLASEYPVKFKVYTDSGESKTLNLNAESLKALTEVFKAIRNLERSK